MTERVLFTLFFSLLYIYRVYCTHIHTHTRIYIYEYILLIYLISRQMRSILTFSDTQKRYKKNKTGIINSNTISSRIKSRRQLLIKEIS